MITRITPNRIAFGINPEKISSEATKIAKKTVSKMETPKGLTPNQSISNLKSPLRYTDPTQDTEKECGPVSASVCAALIASAKVNVIHHSIS